eukprot:gene2609-3842_t
MSDDDFMAQSDDEEYDFDYDSDDDGSDAGAADLENLYYNAKQDKEDDPENALQGFEKVVSTEQPAGQWGFKATKQMVKLYLRMGNSEKVMEKYRNVLEYIQGTTLRKDYSEKSIQRLMDIAAAEAKTSPKLLTEFFQTTLSALAEAKNDRLWFKAKMKLGQMYLEAEDFVPLAKILKELELTCQGPDGADDDKKGNELFQVFSLKFPMLTLQKNTKELKKEYVRALKIKSAIPHPLIMGTIRECGGKMHLAEESWNEAYEDFFEAFKNFDESGSHKRINCLKMLVLANMLMKSNVDPFDAQESKPYRENPEIKAMTQLVQAYQANDIKEFERILRTNRKNLMGDPFVREYIHELLKNIRTEVLIKLIRPYTRIKIPYISKKLNIPSEEVEVLLVGCVLDGTVSGQIDQINQLFYHDRGGASEQRYAAISSWSKQLTTLFGTVTKRIST